MQYVVTNMVGINVDIESFFSLLRVIQIYGYVLSCGGPFKHFSHIWFIDFTDSLINLY